MKQRTRAAVIGALSLGPATGYELKKLFEEKVGLFWSESFGQLYPTLKSLEVEGLAEVEAQAQGGRQKKRYRLTKAGQAELLQWLQAADTPPPTIRNETLLKVFFGAAAPTAVTERTLQIYQRQIEEGLQIMELFREPLLKQKGASKIMLHQYLTWLNGMGFLEAELKWSKEAQKILREEEQHA